jgi:hypothetical protein
MFLYQPVSNRNIPATKCLPSNTDLSHCLRVSESEVKDTAFFLHSTFDWKNQATHNLFNLLQTVKILPLYNFYGVQRYMFQS